MQKTCSWCGGRGQCLDGAGGTFICTCCHGCGRVEVPSPAQPRTRTKSQPKQTVVRPPTKEVGSSQWRANAADGYAKLAALVGGATLLVYLLQTTLSPVVAGATAAIGGFVVLLLLRGPLKFVGKTAAIADESFVRILRLFVSLLKVVIGSAIILGIAYFVAKLLFKF